MSEKYLETIKVIDGVAQNLEYHQERLEGVLNSLNMHNIYNLEQLLKIPKNGFYRCRFIYNEDSYTQEYFEYTKPTVRRLKLIYCEEIDYSKKYENRDALNVLFEKRGSCDDILIVKNDLVKDTTIANIAFFDGKQWQTPKEPLLKGTCRARMLEEGKIIESEIGVEDIKNFKRVALMNAMIDFDIITQNNIEDIIC